MGISYLTRRGVNGGKYIKIEFTGQSPDLNEARYNLVATSIGNYALFGGEDSVSTSSSVVDTYKLNNSIQVYPGTKYKFNNMSEELTSDVFQEVILSQLISGYIKISSTI